MSRQLRRRCEDRLRDLNLPPDLRSIADLVSHIAGVRHRPIYLHPLTLPPGGPSGAWLGTATTDYVFYERSTSPRHQAQIIAHEIGHMTSGHRSSPAAALGPLLLAPAAAEIMLSREAYRSDEEQEAEHMADLLMAYVERAAASPGPMEALETVLQHRPKLA